MIKSFIRNYLSANARKTPITAAELARAFHMPSKSDWHRQVRKAVEELVAEGCPIGGDTRGYLWITNYHQLQRYLNTLQQRQVALCQRIANLYNAYVGEE